MYRSNVSNEISSSFFCKYTENFDSLYFLILGADLKERVKMSSNEISVFLHKLKTVMNKVQHLSIPVIASIDGAAFGKIKYTSL